MMQSNSFSMQVHRRSHRLRTLLIFCLVASSLLAACSRQLAGQAPIPGKEEFGMTKDQLVTNIEKVESLISQCMTKAGFEYIAADYSTVRRGMVADKSLPGLAESQFIQQYGYGISTLYTGLAPQISDV